MSDLSKYQVDHLILIVGGNPLPNAVAGKLLAAPCGTITLVHSGGAAGTAEVAQRLRTWLNEQGVVKCLKLKEVEESNPTSIIQGVQECLETVVAQRVGLNYTGGTKAMSVHAYRVVEQWVRAKGFKPVFSYLDARTLQMVFDPVDAGSSEQREYVGRALQLRLQDLLRLHGWSLREKTQNTPILPKSACALSKLFTHDEAMLQKWKEWISDANQPDVDDIPSEFDQIKQAFYSELQGFDKPKDWMGWLKGKWLEHYVLYSLVNLSASLHLHECAQNIVASEVEFNVDVIALRGYQLLAFSCSTDTKNKPLKLKLFEAYIRARQLGGDEARVALVCCSNDPDGLEREMQRDVDPEGRIRVFGRTHLAGLAAHLTQWIQSQSGEEG